VTLPSGFRLRPARDEDAAAVAAFANEESEAFIGARVVSAQWLLRHWTAPSVNRERDVAVVEAPDGRLCGCLSVQADPPYTRVFALGMVALPHHRRGLGAALVAENEDRAQRFVALADSRVRVVIHTGALADEPCVSALLDAHGYREVRRTTLMRIDFQGLPAPPAALAGLDVRPLLLNDAKALFAAHREAFADHWGDEETYEDFRHHLLDQPEFDPELWVLAWHGEELAGYLGAQEDGVEDPTRGYVNLLGVRRAYRRRGIGETLLRHAFQKLFLRGKRGCDLHVDADSLTGATRLYERVGMRALPRFARWEKELRRAAFHSER
jgi:ribosomal protein S18 acetylase RimI-like enzyme